MGDVYRGRVNMGSRSSSFFSCVEQCGEVCVSGQPKAVVLVQPVGMAMP